MAPYSLEVIMTDKEVGELWNTPMLMPTRKYVECLIRKLVEERARYYQFLWKGDTKTRYKACIDFGIDPAALKIK